jgi:SRSO17 transposase
MMKQFDVRSSWPGRPANEPDSANAKKSEKPERRRRTTKKIKEEAFTGQKLKKRARKNRIPSRMDESFARDCHKTSEKELVYPNPKKSKGYSFRYSDFIKCFSG